jgi:glycosyltransferase involved in cell wall biosynthesis
VLRVLVDVTAVPADRGGVGRYVDNLLPALVDLGVDVRAICQRRDADHYATLTRAEPLLGPKAIEARPARLAWEQAGLPSAAARLAPDVLHCPHYTMPVWRRVPTVVTLHDATFFTEPELHTRTKAPFFRSATRLALRRAAGCVVDSQASADELIRVAGASPAKLQVAHLGVDQSVFAPTGAAAQASVRSRIELADGQDYIAFLGTLEPRKNLPVLIRAWIAACRDRPDPPALVLAGGAGWDNDIDAAIAEVPPQLRLIRPGYLPIDLLAAFLGGAMLMVYPSLGEGFGLPVLEGMACGVAVLTTRRLAIPEVGGDAVAYAEPSVADLAAKLSELLDDPNQRAALAQAGLARSAGFSWKACAEAHIDAYERAVRVTKVTRAAHG